MVEINNLVKNVDQYPSKDTDKNTEQSKQEKIQTAKVNENTSNSMAFMD